MPLLAKVPIADELVTKHCLPDNVTEAEDRKQCDAIGGVHRLQGKQWHTTFQPTANNFIYKKPPMQDDLQPPEHFALIAVLFEASLLAVALGLGWLCGYAPAATLHFSGSFITWGLAATVPPLILFWTILKCPWAPFLRLTDYLERRLVPMFLQCGWFDLAAISIVAGIGEEMLFRGLLQGGLAEAIGGPAGIWIGLIIASVLFGLAHPISLTYGVLTGVIGLYLGGIWILSGNLLTPIITHAVYDFLVLAYLVKLRRTATT